MKKTNPELKPGERLDDLMIRRMKIIQHEKQFCFSLDAVLVAHFATLKAKAGVFDLGTGTGVIAFLLAARGAGKVDALEINPLMADMARRSAALNGLEGRVAIHAMDLKRVRERFPAGSADLVVTNPPYWPLGKGKLSEADDVAVARHEIAAALADVVESARYLLKYRGRFAMVHLPERLSEIMVLMHGAGIEPKRMRLVQSRTHKPPAMVLVEGASGARPGLRIEPPLVVYEADGAYTEEILQYYREE